MAANANLVYPLYKQCNPQWGSIEMGVSGPGERATICQEGCAMTSLSMVLFGLGVSVSSSAANPASLNTWLMANNGYTCMDGDCNNLVLASPEGLTGRLTLIGENPPPSISSIEAGLVSGTIAYLAHVRNRTHFVLLTGYAGGDNFTVNDPGFTQYQYTYGDISDIIMYTINPPAIGKNGAAGRLLKRSVRSGLVESPVIPKIYPLFSQCDPAWGGNMMENETICAVGCLMSSISMALNGHAITISDDAANPGTFNTWLQDNNGYTSQSDLIESSVPALSPTHIMWTSNGMHTTNNVAMSVIESLLQNSQPVIANVMDGMHFILVVGWDSSNPDTLYVNDPGFDKDTYSYSKDVVGWRLFNMTYANVTDSK